MLKEIFYIEPFVYSNLIGNKLLLYNTFTYTSLEFTFNDIVALNMIEKLFLNGINRSIENNNYSFSNFEFDQFIQECKKMFMGDLIQCSKTPFVLNFKSKVNYDNRKTGLKGNWESLNLRTSLQEINLIINNPKTLCENELLLEFGFKQILFPCYALKTCDNISIFKLKKFLGDFDISKLAHVSIIGDIFVLNKYELFLNYFQNIKIKICLYYKDVSDNYFFLIEKYGLENTEVLIWVDQNFDFKRIECLYKTSLLSKIPIKFVFVVSKENDIRYIEDKLSNIITNYNLVPFYDKTNLLFFEKNVFNIKSDILNQKLEDRELLSRMYINQLYYGKLFILPDGFIYSNPNLNNIGKIDNDNLLDVLKNVNFNEKEAWLMTRNNVMPCKDCIYQLLCGSISNYEYFMGKMNLCHYNTYSNEWYPFGLMHLH